MLAFDRATGASARRGSAARLASRTASSDFSSLKSSLRTLRNVSAPLLRVSRAGNVRTTRAATAKAQPAFVTMAAASSAACCAGAWSLTLLSPWPES